MYITNTSLTTGVVALKSPGDFGTTKWQKLDNPGSAQYHYEGWLFIKTLPSENGTILQRKLKNFATGLILKGSSLTFSKATNIGTVTNNVAGPLASTTDLVSITDNFPIQKWVYFVVNVKDKLVECYLNGKLIKSQLVTDDLTPATRTDLYLGDGSIDGYVTKFKRDATVLTPDQVWKQYLAGNGLATFTNWLAGYNATFSLYTTTEEIKKYSLL
jgi:hypothetical protein